MSKDYKAIAKKFRSFIETMAKDVSDQDAYDHPEAFPYWKVGFPYIKDDRVRYKDALFKVLQNHVSQEDWTPDVAVSLFVEISDPSQVWPEWKQPSGSHDAYEFGSKVSHLIKEDGSKRHWISTYKGANVWEPGVYGWEEV
ncbi:MAG: hypothetical protein IKO38_07055 [Erysipelotrichaceae bacterium]|nr:hypothetical protein [Erysipelotrichaceae bacterium]